jgi:hypothetical protein
MVSMSDELKERNILKLILIVRFACATIDVGHLIVIMCLRPSFRFGLQVIVHPYHYGEQFFEMEFQIKT